MNEIINARGTLSKYLENNSLTYGKLFVAKESNGTLGIYAGDPDNKPVKVGVDSVASYQGKITNIPEIWIHGGIYIYVGEEPLTILGSVFTENDTFMYITSDGMNSTETTDENPLVVPLGKGILDATNITVDNSVHTRLGSNAQESFELSDYAKFEYGGTVAQLITRDITDADRGCFFIQNDESPLTVTFNEVDYVAKHGSIIFIYGKDSTNLVVYNSVDKAADIDFSFDTTRKATAEDLGLESLPEELVATVKEALDTLLSTKADIAADGKVPESQLPTTSDSTFMGEDNAIPVFKDKNLVESSIYQISPDEETSTLDVGFVFKGNTIVTAKAPSTSGTLLVDTSYIDCGLYDSEGNITYPAAIASLSLTESIEAHIEN